MFDSAAHAHRILAILEAGDVMDTTKGYRCEYPGGWAPETGPCLNASLYKEDMIELVKDNQAMLFCPGCAQQAGKFGWMGNSDGMGSIPFIEDVKQTYDGDDSYLGFFDIAFNRVEGLDLVSQKEDSIPKQELPDLEALEALERAKNKKTTHNRTFSTRDAITFLGGPIENSKEDNEPLDQNEYDTRGFEVGYKQGDFFTLMYAIRMMGSPKLTDMQKREYRLANKRRKARRKQELKFGGK